MTPDLSPASAAFLQALVFQQGVELESSGASSIRSLGGMYFVSSAASGAIRGPYPTLEGLFAAEGNCLLDGPGGRILEWEGLVFSLDSDGRAAGPYAGFDEWLWTEADTVLAEDAGGRAGVNSGCRVHHWRGHYFISVDPLPASHDSFESSEGAFQELRRLARIVPLLRGE